MSNKKIKRKFVTHIRALKLMIIAYIGEHNYAGRSSIDQLDRVKEKFLDCIDDDD